jgi:hypothetical protein
VLRWAADTAAVWKACTKKLSAVSRQLSVGSKAPLARVGLFFGAAAEMVPSLTNIVRAARGCGYHLIVDLGEVRKYLRRTNWHSFPDVVILADVPAAKRHPLFSAAKAGDAKAAEALVDDVLAIGPITGLGSLIGHTRPHLLAVHAVEDVGMNAIPRALARVLSVRLDLPVATGIVQMNRVGHTGAGGYHRLAFPAVFEGDVNPVDYVLVDDFVGQGGTLANLRGYVESNGAHVLGAVTLTGKGYSAKLCLQDGTLSGLREKHGKRIEEWWAATYGYSFERLTESEARYLTRSDDANTISTRIADARRAGN